ncbi:PTS fructose transporter subunit IIA [Raoultella sp. WB_B2P2-3]|jgi:D-glucosaminate-specific PTS system IIA component|uniref:EIIAB-Man n=2 Tax=Raoultella TaxID=160674 RepID=A0A3P8KF23_RAOTE|nr:MULTISPECIES: PTS fructose transporter subunit IIA [Enterobacteriaceae]MVT02488.1 PTS fructose transporter subunit IIA [Raoultella sp. 10-1]PAC14975.1 PTS fructose transporter subunit IIA [Enterobacter sp. 10-1]VDR27565.1 EIIAB-Man [Raoultella terrigena]
MDQKIAAPWILVISHGGFGRELVKSCEMILGKMDNVYCFSLEPGMAPEQLMDDISALLSAAPENIIIFTDIYAGTPSNVAAIFAKLRGYPVICGMNLPMLIEAEMQREEVTLSELVSRIIEAGNGSIKNITSITNGNEYE